jgi:hypothetical protein
MGGSTEDFVANGLAQLELIDPREIAESAERVQIERGEHTGALTLKRDPKKFALVLRLYREGMGQLKIADVLDMGVHTVRACIELAKANGGARDTSAVVAMMRAGQMLAVEAIAEDLEDKATRKKIAFRDKGIVLGVLTDKVELLSGGPTARIEHTQPVPEPKMEEFERWLEGKTVEAEVSEPKGVTGEK